MSEVDARHVVVYVDALRSNRVVFERAFGEAFRVETFECGIEALAFAQRVGVTVFMVDMRIPAMVDEWLLRELRAITPTTIRIVMTTYVEVGTIMRAIDERLAARYVVKPWDRRHVLQLIEWAIETRASGEVLVGLEPRLN